MDSRLVGCRFRVQGWRYTSRAYTSKCLLSLLASQPKLSADGEKARRKKSLADAAASSTAEMIGQLNIFIPRIRHHLVEWSSIYR